MILSDSEKKNIKLRLNMQSDEHKIEREKEFMRKKNAENSL